MTVQLVAATDEFVVVNKPSGMLTHPVDEKEDSTALTHWLVQQFPEIARVGDEPALRPGLVHRLDREASGLLVVARTQKSFENLKRQFIERTIEKEYLALVHGRVVRDHGEINFSIGRGRDGRMAARPSDDEDSREARTEFFVERRFTNATLLRVRIHSGRTHQIRVHLFAIQHPVVGDPLYAPRKIAKSFPPAPRLFLHATHLSFVDTRGERQTFDAPMPPEFEMYMQQLRIVA